MGYDLDLERAIVAIRKNKAKKVLVQLPEGLKPLGPEIADRLEQETGADVHLWAGTCFGACDIPQVKGYDLLIQWGHNEMTR
jgi:2-(3-amino-3-carboxypropyl)histidine synthase